MMRKGILLAVLLAVVVGTVGLFRPAVAGDFYGMKYVCIYEENLCSKVEDVRFTSAGENDLLTISFKCVSPSGDYFYYAQRLEYFNTEYYKVYFKGKNLTDEEKKKLKNNNRGIICYFTGEYF